MLVGRRAEELAQPGRRGVLERRRYRTWQSATGQCPRFVGAHLSAVRNPAGRAVAHGALQPPRLTETSLGKESICVSWT